MQLSETAFQAASKRMAAGVLNDCRGLNMAEQDIANLMLAALGLVMAETLGPVVAIERLRDAADHMEDDILQRGRPH